MSVIEIFVKNVSLLSISKSLLDCTKRFQCLYLFSLRHGKMAFLFLGQATGQPEPCIACSCTCEGEMNQIASDQLDSVQRDHCFAVGIFRWPPNLTYMSCTFTIYTLFHNSYMPEQWLSPDGACYLAGTNLTHQVLLKISLWFLIVSISHQKPGSWQYDWLCTRHRIHKN